MYVNVCVFIVWFLHLMCIFNNFNNFKCTAQCPSAHSVVIIIYFQSVSSLQKEALSSLNSRFPFPLIPSP